MVSDYIMQKTEANQGQQQRGPFLTNTKKQAKLILNIKET
jgi:hypothetical protein